MPSKQNVKELEKIAQKKADAKSVFFAHYQGMTVNQMSELRQKVRDAGGEMLVTKNTLLRRGFGNDDLSEVLAGPTVAIFSYDDEVAALKEVTQFAKANELPTLTGGYMDDRYLDGTAVTQLAKLPSKLELQAQVVGQLAAPLTGLLTVLQGNTRGLVYALNAIKEQKENTVSS